MTTNASTPTLVIGGTGKTGRRVADRLRALRHPVRIGSRAGEPAFDWNDPTTWSSALSGVGAAYVVFTPDLAFPGAAETLGAFAGVAADQGVSGLVLLSGRGEEEAQHSEEAVRAVMANVTVIRSSWFMQNFSEFFLLEPVLDGVVALPAGSVAEPFIDVEDIADVAVAALTDESHQGQIYELTGPRLLTFAEAAAEIALAAGRPVAYLPVTAEEYAAGAIEAGVPPEEVEAWTELFTRVLDGRNASLTGDVERVLGRPARDFSAYAAATAATGVWHVPSEVGIR